MEPDEAEGAESSVADMARQRRTPQVDVLIDLTLAAGFQQLFRQPISDTSTEQLAARPPRHS